MLILHSSGNHVLVLKCMECYVKFQGENILRHDTLKIIWIYAYNVLIRFVEIDLRLYV